MNRTSNNPSDPRRMSISAGILKKESAKMGSCSKNEIFYVSMMESGTDCVMRGKMKALMLFIGCFLLSNVKAN